VLVVAGATSVIAVHPIDADPTYPAAFVWFARLIVVGLVICLLPNSFKPSEHYFERSEIGDAMTTKSAARQILLAIAAFILRCLRRLSKRLAAPGSGPFLAGC
jgi:hypothetical protein